MAGVCFVDTETTCPRCGASADRLLRYRGLGEAVCNRCYQNDRRRALGIAPRPFRTAAQRRRDEARLAREAHQRRRRQVVAAYGGACACCSEADPAFLAIDHIVAINTEDGPASRCRIHPWTDHEFSSAPTGALPPWNSNDLSRAVGVGPEDFDRHTALGDARWAKAIYEAVTGKGA